MTTPTETIVRPPAPVASVAGAPATQFTLAGVRLALGWASLWVVLDKTFGISHRTGATSAWINGGSPTEDLLKFAATGPFQSYYHGIVGTAWADWLFMGTLAVLGVALCRPLRPRRSASGPQPVPVSPCVGTATRTSH